MNLMSYIYLLKKLTKYSEKNFHHGTILLQISSFSARFRHLCLREMYLWYIKNFVKSSRNTKLKSPMNNSAITLQQNDLYV